MTRRGRPQLHSDEAVLDAALRAFSQFGYDGTSVRALNSELGLSHETITQRFGNKADLLRAAVAHGLVRFMAVLDAEVIAAAPHNDLELLRAMLRAFMLATARHPALGRLLHQAAGDPERAVLASEVGLNARMVEFAVLLRRLSDAGVIRPTPLRVVWFLAESAAGPLHLAAMADMFDPLDGPFDPEAHLEASLDAIMRSLRPDPI